jgi:uncharacterized protein YegJ (DUF2314 family)
MRKLWSLLAGTLPIVGGCQRSPADGGNQGSSLAVAVPTEDPAIEAATREARASLEEFIKPLSHPSPGQTDFSVKVPVREGAGTHYLWLQQIAFDGSNFSGVLGPDAAGLNGHSPGEWVTIASREIADWMFVENEKLVGASARGRSASGCRVRLARSLRRACGSSSSSRRTATAQRVFYC